jgi:uncharacterized membrane protein YeaQ/YmgE (transglycosylase-associated protein family)
MSFFSWVIVGALAGRIASMLMGKSHKIGLLGNIILGVIGAFVGGFILKAIGVGGAVTGINISSIFVATLGAVVVLFIANKYG